ncbi:DUF2511 domain-containing protein [Leptolyngbyaceae cyanobacterium UHCC 1019]
MPNKARLIIWTATAAIGVGIFVAARLRSDSSPSNINATSVLPTSITISQQTWGDEYPLTLSGLLECESDSAVVFKANGKLYAVNGAAKNKYGNTAMPIEEVWKDSAKIPGAKMNISGVIDEGLKLCH